MNDNQLVNEDKFFKGFVNYYEKNVDEEIHDVTRLEFVYVGDSTFMLRVQSRINIYQHREAYFNDFVRFEKEYFKSKEWGSIVRDKEFKKDTPRIQAKLADAYNRPYLSDNLFRIQDMVKSAFDLYQAEFNEKLKEEGSTEVLDKTITVKVRLRPTPMFPEDYVKGKIEEFYDPTGDKELAANEAVKIAKSYEGSGFSSAHGEVEMLSNTELGVKVLPIGDHIGKLKKDVYKSSVYLDAVKGRWATRSSKKLALYMDEELLAEADYSTELENYKKGLERAIIKAIAKLISDGEISSSKEPEEYAPMLRVKIDFNTSQEFFKPEELKVKLKEDRKKEAMNGSRGRKGSSFRRMLRM